MGGPVRGRGGRSGMPPGWPVEAVPLATDRAHEAGECLGRALTADPLLGYAVPDLAKRSRRLSTRVGLALVRHGQRFGVVYATAGPIEGVAIWRPPEGWAGAVWRPLRTVALARSLGLDPADAWRFVAAWRQLEAARRRAAPDPAWHLLVLGVNPPRQDLGIEDALLRPILARADATGTTCCLTSLRARAVLRFAQHGFEVAGEGDLPAGGPRYWAMRRDPHS